MLSTPRPRPTAARFGGQKLPAKMLRPRYSPPHPQPTQNQRTAGFSPESKPLLRNRWYIQPLLDTVRNHLIYSLWLLRHEHIACAPLAQLAEQRILNPRVVGSSPSRRTRLFGAEALGFRNASAPFLFAAHLRETISTCPNPCREFSPFSAGNSKHSGKTLSAPL